VVLFLNFYDRKCCCDHLVWFSASHKQKAYGTSTNL